MLHSACRAISVSCLTQANIDYAEIALKIYIETNAKIYGEAFVTYNVHGLLHVVQDVKIFANLHSYSAFPYEDNMRFFRKYLRKPHLFLQQLHHRLSEQDNCLKEFKESEVKPLYRHTNGPLPEIFNCNTTIQYRELQCLNTFD